MDELWDKPFLTFEEQIDKLKNEYKLTINDDNFALEALSSLSYYDLINGYQSIYKPQEEYMSGTTIEQLFSTHIFNKNIQGVLLKYSTYVENSFKTILSHIIASKYKEHQNEYLDISNYIRHRIPKKREKLGKLIARLKKTCEECTDTPTKFYRENKNHIPPWILFRNISFSDATDLFQFLKPEDKQSLFSLLDIFNTDSLSFEEKVNISLDALNLTRIYRNKIAHNLDFLTYRGSHLNKRANLLFHDSLVAEAEIDTTRNNIWAMVLSIIILLNNRYLIQNFLGEFNSFMILDRDISTIYCGITGIPLDYEDRIEKYLTTISL